MSFFLLDSVNRCSLSSTPRQGRRARVPRRGEEGSSNFEKFSCFLEQGKRGKGAREDAVNRCNVLNYILLLQSKEYGDNKGEISLKRVL